MEGNSAGGTAVHGRTSEFQAILPLRGKILNVEKARIDKVFSNTEIQAMVTAMGTGTGEEFDLEKARYHKLIVMTDADVDGAHIRTLILTFLFRHMPGLIEAGYVYIAAAAALQGQAGPGAVLHREGRPARGAADPRAPGAASWSRRQAARRVALTPARYQRSRGALREHEGWARPLRAEHGAAAIEFVQRHGAARGRVGRPRRRSARFFAAGPADDDEHTVEVVDHRRGSASSVLVRRTERHTGTVSTIALPMALFASDALRQPARGARPAARAGRRAAVHGHAAARARAWPPPTRRCGARCSALAREGIELSRFKGLGEMNAEQLWETTMDPETRILQQVTMEDAQAAEELFTLLMGDKVEPRRDFIETNARDVRSLDV